MTPQQQLSMKSILRTIFVFICGGVGIVTLFLTFVPMLNHVDITEDEFFIFYNFSFGNLLTTEKTADFDLEFLVPTDSLVNKSTRHLTKISSSSAMRNNQSISFTTQIIYSKSTSRRMENFSDFLFDFPWEKLEEGINNASVTSYRQRLVDGLQTFALQEPLIPMNESCRPPKLIDPKDIKCSDYPMAFRNNKYETPVKVAHAIQLGFDADSLEIHLNEIYDTVDHFFILEATRLHCLGMRKQLSWSELSSQPRFSRFREKVVHFVVDDADLAEIKWSKETAFKLEELQELSRWRKIRKWNEVTKSLKGRDIIGFGDADEIPSRKNIQLLKYCPLKFKSIDIGIWFPFGRMDQAYKSDFPVSKEHKFTLGDPSFYTWKRANEIKEPEYPTRKRGHSKGYLLGGTHLTYYTYVPYFMLRMLSATECLPNAIFTKQIMQSLAKTLLSDTRSLKEIETLMQARKNLTNLKMLKDVKEDISAVIVRPWFYECNPERYPAWFGMHDLRVS